MNTHEIQTILEADPIVRQRFRGVFSIDRLPEDRVGAMVVNTSPSHVPFGHWVAIVDQQFFCSFGTDPRVYGIDGINSYNQQRIQATNSDVCGLYAITYVKCKCRGYTLESYLQCFTDITVINDAIVQMIQ